MMRLFSADASGRIVRTEAPGDGTLPSDLVWIDLLRPSDGDRHAVESALGVELPTFQEMQEIEASSRTYSENGIHVVTTGVVARIDAERPDLGVLTFVVTEQVLVTMRYIEPKSIDQFMDRLCRQSEPHARPVDLLVGILEVLIDRMADALELIGTRLEALSQSVFLDPSERRQNRDLRGVLRGIGLANDFVGKIRDSLGGIERMAAYLSAVSLPKATALPQLKPPPSKGAKDGKARLKTITRDVKSLALHSDFVVQRLTFLLDATLGVISVDQNDIVKSFSVAAVAFLPPTLIASLYGMNFDIMPELHWPLGYPFAIVLMLLSAVLPLWYFKRKGWL
jgi:magnesium transporter